MDPILLWIPLYLRKKKKRKTFSEKVQAINNLKNSIDGKMCNKVNIANGYL